ncbi:hypothetical protein GC584_11045 [Corynebacterium sp. zg912]|uniref:Alpha helical Porin B n=1 Tax=Corynebacterium wankanglinii TaxID=2735136 RepID=A0A7H0K9C8_9CORY|nr:MULTISPECIES: hypothetical protein [Corynebacterium]MBA1838408.1 hypothetical protein [Corynebacterium wankanglinii]MCR5929922.1 hypothetical protein [Corynebacterium sp. zg912]QNP93894.1 hypothetical protein IA203_08855 [Corynebacterium wankanglinii]
MRRLASLAAAGLVAAAAFAGTAAPAQAQNFELIKLLNGNVATANCDVLRASLTATRMVGPDTTRSQLIGNVNAVVGQDATLRLASASTVATLGDRALECGIVKPDPATPLDKFFEMSSQMSSQANLPDIRTYIGALR